MQYATAAGLEQGNAMIDRIFKNIEGAFKEFHQEEARRLFRIRALMDPVGYPVYYYEELATSCSLIIGAKYRCKLDMEKVVEASHTFRNERQAICARDALYQTMKMDGMVKIIAPNGVIWALERKDGEKGSDLQNSASKTIQKPRNHRGYIEFNRHWREGFDYIESIVSMKNYGGEVKLLAEKLFVVCTIWTHKRFVLGEFRSLAMILVIIAAKDLGRRIDIRTVCNENFCHMNATGINIWMERVSKCLVETEAVEMLNNPKHIKNKCGLAWQKTAWKCIKKQEAENKKSGGVLSDCNRNIPPLLRPVSGWDEVDKANKPHGQLINGVWFP